MTPSLFRHTPPTALIVDDTQMFPAVVNHLARLGISAPKNVSLACTDASAHFEWYRPRVTHIAWSHTAAINRVVNWANRMSRGSRDRRHTRILAKLVPGGTIGPVQEN